MQPSRQNLRKYAKLLAFLTLVLLSLEGCQGCRNLKSHQDQNNPKTIDEPKPDDYRTPPDADIDPGGIPNRGNTCYLNSVMQIIAKLYPNAFDGDNTRTGKAGKEIIDKIKDDKEGATRTQAQTFYDAYLSNATNTFGHEKMAQEDASEALIVLLDLMGKAPKATLERSFQYTTAQTKAFPSKVNTATQPPKKSELFSFLTVPPGDTPKTMGQLVNEYLRGDNEEHTFCNRPIKGKEDGEKVFNDLKNQYPAPAFRIKKIFERDGAHNETAKIASIEVKGNLKTTNYTLTDSRKLKNRILPIKLGRYSYSEASGATKLKTLVQNPLNFTLNTNSAEDGTITYELVGFILHDSNTLQSGHYTAYVERDGQWIHYNDATVEKIDQSAATAAAQQAYLYFYKPTT